MTKKIAACLLLVIIVGGVVLTSQSSDGAILVRLGQIIATRATANLPDRSNLAGPIVSFKLGDRLPIEEQVRLRIQADKTLGQQPVEVLVGNGPGIVRLRGIVTEGRFAQEILQVAANTRGVETVINELAVPEAAKP